MLSEIQERDERQTCLLLTKQRGDCHSAESVTGRGSAIPGQARPLSGDGTYGKTTGYSGGLDQRFREQGEEEGRKEMTTASGAAEPCRPAFWSLKDRGAPAPPYLELRKGDF